MGRLTLRPVVLLPSILLGPVSWQAAAGVLRSRGRAVTVADPRGAATPAEALQRYLAATPDAPATVVGHSNAGFLLPGVLAARPDAAAVYVDASLPDRHGPTVMAEGPRLEALLDLAGGDGMLPPWPTWWGEDELAGMLPSAGARRELAAVGTRVPVAYFTSQIACPDGWERRRCGYLSFDGSYEQCRRQAEGFGWPTAQAGGGHLHPMQDPAAVVDAVLELERRLVAAEA